jgi:hypothetical protein
VASGEREDLLASAEEERIGRNRKRAHSHLDHLDKDHVEIALAAGMQDVKLQSKFTRRRVKFLCLALGHWEVRVHEHCHNRGGGNQFVQ